MGEQNEVEKRLSEVEAKIERAGNLLSGITMELEAMHPVVKRIYDELFGKNKPTKPPRIAHRGE